LNEGSRKGSQASGGRGQPFGSIEDNYEEENEYPQHNYNDYDDEEEDQDHDEQ